MKWITNITIQEVPNYTSKGMMVGRPRASGPMSVDDMEKLGLVGVYEDPSSGNGSLGYLINPYKSHGLIDIGGPPPVGPNPFKDELESTLDDRIKEVQRAKPAKYRARWTGTKYVYDPIK